ncbi:DUF7490 domain-containing protein [Halomarina litorea]|uniref:DUF7490 domain-containing protein n=1 Tax=Halomarina litorea TaxID=2961595 RepID=UPI0020C2C22C|nr:PGF-CTERM sorting domain-containing protein [Halomarina sp. BCD28]
MDTRTLLVAAAVAVTVLSVGTAAVAPDVVADPPTDPPPESHLSVTEMTIGPGTVTGETATLRVETFLDHRGGPAENVTVLVRAVDSESGMLETVERVRVGDLTAARERGVPANLTVAREGGYRIESVVYVADRRVETAARTVSGLDGLRPPYLRSGLQFHRFSGADLPAVEFSVRSAGDGRTTLDVSAFLTNTGDDPATDLELVVKARQADSNIVADEARVAIGEVRSGRTVTPSVNLTVPTDYNYYLDAVLLRDDVVVDTVRAPAALDPTETISVNTTRREVDLEVSDFESDTNGQDSPQPTPSDRATTSGDGPGFGVLAALAALLAAVGIARRRST